MRWHSWETHSHGQQPWVDYAGETVVEGQGQQEEAVEGEGEPYLC